MTGILPRLVQTDEPAPASVLVGTLGKSPLIDRLVEAGKLDASSVSGQWESYLIATVDDCLVIAGSDKRGTIYGIIMGTSHHEPMMRAHKEYTRRRDEVGEWNYATNKTRLDRFFRDGLERNRTYDNLITIGMRGDGDVAMGKGDDEENMQTLAKVVEGQRAIISEVYGRPASEVPQLWAIFTEVQRYYDKGFTVPDDEAPLTLDARQGFKDEFAEYASANLAKSPNLKPLPRQDTSIRLTGTGQLRRNEVFDNLRWLTVKLPVRSAGLHTLKVFMTDPEVVLERIVVNPDNRHPSYFGAPSVRHNVR